MNKIVFILFICTLVMSAQGIGSQWNTRPANKSPMEKDAMIIDSAIIVAIKSAYADPYHFIRTNRIERLISLLKNNITMAVEVVPFDSLSDEIINSSKIRRNNYDRCVLNIIRYAQIRNRSREVAKQSLQIAALLAFRKIDDPRLALSIYELAQASGYTGAPELVKRMQHYLEHDYTHLSLLKKPWRRKKEKEKLAYIAQMQNLLDQNPESLLELKFSRQIGDVYYSMKQYRPMIRWYRKAVASDSTIEKETPVGYRIELGKKVLFRKSILTVIYVVYGIIVLLVIIALFQLKKIKSRIFFKRILFTLPIFVIIAVFVLMLDFKMTSGSISSILNGSKVYFPKPHVVFSVSDFSCAKDFIFILLLGYVPILLSIFYTSFIIKNFKRLLYLVLPLTILSTWSHYLIGKVFDDKLNKLAVMTKSHLYFDGELEDLLTQNPQKILKANPDLLKSGNKDLEIFLKQNKPQLFQN